MSFIFFSFGRLMSPNSRKWHSAYQVQSLFVRREEGPDAKLAKVNRNPSMAFRIPCCGIPEPGLGTWSSGPIKHSCTQR